MAGIAGYTYKPLERPRTQIRLLQLEAADQPEIPSYTMTIWDTDNAPAYASISYTWGSSALTESIYLENCICSITKNAQDALDQVVLKVLHDKIKYIWIDAICINQGDPDEKSHQVQRMVRTYAAATVVFACVGQHEHGSEVLLRTLKTMRSRRFFEHLSREEGDKKMLLLEACTPWIDPEDQKELPDIFTHLNDVKSALTDFADRRYWWRLWIVQELFYSRHPPRVLCGDGEISLDTLQMAGDLLFPYLGMPSWRITETRWAGEAKTDARASLDIYYTLKTFRASQCNDPRDKVYGLLSLTNQANSALLQPDYTITSAQLALRMLPFLWQYIGTVPALDEVAELLQTLHIFSANEIWPESYFRRVAATLRKDRKRRVKALANDNSRRIRFLSPICQLAATASFSKGLQLIPFTPEECWSSLHQDIWRKTAPPDSKRRGVQLFVEESLVGHASWSARPGDYVVELCDSVTARVRIWLVLRRINDTNSLTVVGIAELHPEIHLCATLTMKNSGDNVYLCQKGTHTAVQLFIEDSDLLFLALFAYEDGSGSVLSDLEHDLPLSYGIVTAKTSPADLFS